MLFCLLKVLSLKLEYLPDTFDTKISIVIQGTKGKKRKFRGTKRKPLIPETRNIRVVRK